MGSWKRAFLLNCESRRARVPPGIQQGDVGQSCVWASAAAITDYQHFCLQAAFQKSIHRKQGAFLLVLSWYLACQKIGREWCKEVEEANSSASAGNIIKSPHLGSFLGTPLSSCYFFVVAPPTSYVTAHSPVGVHMILPCDDSSSSSSKRSTTCVALQSRLTFSRAFRLLPTLLCFSFFLRSR